MGQSRLRCMSFLVVLTTNPPWKQPVCLYSMLAASLPSHSLRSNKDNSLSVPRVPRAPTQVQELFTLVCRLLGITSHYLSVQPFQLLPSKTSRDTSLWLGLPFPRRHRHARRPVDVMELFLWFGCWTLIPLSRHWVWLYWGYWRYRNLIDWLIN